MKGISKGQLIVVSNREPYSLKKGKLEKSVGGLVSAMDPVMQEQKGVWIAAGSAAEGRKPSREAKRFMVPPENPSYTVRLVPLTPRDVEGYYNGYSNRFLWPLCHIALDRIYLRKFYWHRYKKVNELFARAVVEEAKKDAVVWLQDYHLALCAKYIRELKPKARTSIFWHIPWPPHDVFRACPQRKELLEGMLANDLIGFQLDSFGLNFLRCVGRELGARPNLAKRTVTYRGITTRVKAFPISVDFDWFESAAGEKKAEGFIRRFRRDKALEGLKVGLTVERLDYTKGVIKSLEAVEFFFAKYPRFKGNFTMVMVAVPTRKVEPYLSYMERVRKKVDSVNKKFSPQPQRARSPLQGRRPGGHKLHIRRHEPRGKGVCCFPGRHEGLAPCERVCGLFPGDSGRHLHKPLRYGGLCRRNQKRPGDETGEDKGADGTGAVAYKGKEHIQVGRRCPR
jgi:trehalose 6-phosphate synthase